VGAAGWVTAFALGQPSCKPIGDRAAPDQLAAVVVAASGQTRG
jgi:hypothetical protein